MKRATILMLLIGLLLPSVALAQGEQGDDEAGGGDEAGAQAGGAEGQDGTEGDATSPVPAVPAVPAVPDVWGAGAPEAEQAAGPEGPGEAAETKADEVAPAEQPKPRQKPDFVHPGNRYLSLLTSISLSIGGDRIAVTDEGWRALAYGSGFDLAQWELGVMVTPRIGVSISGMQGEWWGGSVDWQGDSEDDYDGIELSTRVAAWEVTGRFVPTPPFFPIRGYVRAGGGGFLVHARAMDYSGDNLGQRDYRGSAGFAVVGLGAEIGSPTRAGRRAVPLAMGVQIEGGARLGGGGEVVAAPSSPVGVLGRFDLGPWYFRVAFQASVWPTPRKTAAQ